MSKSTLTNLAETIVDARLTKLRAEREEMLTGILLSVARGETLSREVLNQGFPIDAETDCSLGYMDVADLRRIAVYRLTKYTRALQDAMDVAEAVETICQRIEASDGNSLDEIASA